MKALSEMNNVEKGRLLADLFPEELPNLISGIEKNFAFLMENEEVIIETWDTGIITVQYWYKLAHEVKALIDTHGEELYKDKRLFSEKLFEGYYAFYTIDCIVKCAEKEGISPTLRHAIQMIF